RKTSPVREVTGAPGLNRQFRIAANFRALPMNDICDDNKSNVLSITQAEVAIPKPGGFDLNKFRSKRSAAIAGVETLQTALPVHRLAEAKDFVRLHRDEDEYWS